MIEDEIGNERHEAKTRNAIRHIPGLLKFAGSMVPEGPSMTSKPFIVDKE